MIWASSAIHCRAALELSAPERAETDPKWQRVAGYLHAFAAVQLAAIFNRGDAALGTISNGSAEAKELRSKIIAFAFPDPSDRQIFTERVSSAMNGRNGLIAHVDAADADVQLQLQPGVLTAFSHVAYPALPPAEVTRWPRQIHELERALHWEIPEFMTPHAPSKP